MKMVKRFVIFMGMILILLSVVVGVLAIILSLKFMYGSWLSLKQYIVAVLSLGTAGFWIAFSGLLLSNKIDLIVK